MADVHVIWMNFAATGHMNPTLAVVSELGSRGFSVTYYVEESMRDVVEAAGATWRQIPYPNPKAAAAEQKLDAETLSRYVPEGTPEHEYSGALLMPFVSELILPALIEDLRSLSPPPSVLVYDPFLTFAPVSAHVLGISPVSLLTVPGPGALMRSAVDELESKPWVQGPRRAILRAHSYDILEGGLVLESYSSLQNIVTTVEELYLAPNGEQRQRFRDLPFLCVGPLIDAKIQRLTNAKVVSKLAEAESEAAAFVTGKPNEFWSPLPWERIHADVAARRKVVFVSLGTVVNDYFWDRKFGPLGSGNGVSDVTGREFCRQIWASCFEAFGGRDDVLLILAVGNAEGTFECLPSHLPENVVLRATVAQLDLLPWCSVFVSHGGANSVHEALMFGVPIVVVPIFGDQPLNGDQVQGKGAGVCLKDPLCTVTPDALRCAVDDLVADEPNQYRLAASVFAEKFRLAGGVSTAIDEILRLSKTNTSWLGA